MKIVSAKRKAATWEGGGVGPKNQKRFKRANCWATRDKFSAHTERGYLFRRGMAETSYMPQPRKYKTRPVRRGFKTKMHALI
jgi:hypothetical protein